MMKQNSYDNESFSKASFNWYPGHMAKTKRQMIEDLKLIDVVVEILDARIPVSSSNPDINEIVKEKPKVVVLNKSDLADERQNKAWIEYFNKKGVSVVLADCNSGKGINEVSKEIMKQAELVKQKEASKGRVGRSVRTMVLGIPNVGKSSFINRISKKNTAEVGNKPGVTRKKQWIRLNNGIELMDTPGVLWPKFENEQVALNLAYTGTIKEDVIEPVEVAYSLLKVLLEEYKQNVIERYKLQNIDEMDTLEVMYEIGRKRGAIVSGGNIDEEKTAKIIIDDFRNAKLGRITLEKPNK